MINNVNVEGYVAKISNFVYAGDKTGVHFDLGHQVYHGKTEKANMRSSRQQVTYKSYYNTIWFL